MGVRPFSNLSFLRLKSDTNYGSKAEVRKFHPLIIDINDTHPNFTTFKRQSQKRITFYKQQKYKIMLHRIDGIIEEYKKKPKKIATKGQCLIDDD